MSLASCEIFGCGRDPKVDATVTAVIGEETVTVKVCEEHQIFFSTMDPEWYDIGFTYRHEVEVRPRPAVPVEG